MPAAAAARDAERPGRRRTARTVLALDGALVVAVGALSSVLPGLGPCGGDGGTPRAAPGSTQADACRVADAVPYLPLWLGLACFAIAVLAGAVWVRRDTGFARFVVASAVAALAAPLCALALAAPPG